MAQTLELDVFNIADVVRVFDRIKIFRSDAREGVFAEVTTPQTRPILAAGQVQYLFIDSDGDDGSWYASTYFNSITRAESSRTEPQQTGSDAALSLVSVDHIKRHYLYGLKFVDRQGRPLPDAIIENGIRSAIAWVERMLDLTILPLVVKDERHDFRRSMSRAFLWTDLNKTPVQSVDAVRLVFPGQPAASSTLPKEWVQFDSITGAVEIVPQRASGAGAFQLAPIASYALGSPAMSFRDRIPGAMRFDYIAGFVGNRLPADLLDVVSKAACLGPLAIAGDLVGPPGVASQSVSIDGLSQSVSSIASATSNAYSARINAYNEGIASQLTLLRSAYKGLSMRVS